MPPVVIVVNDSVILGSSTLFHKLLGDVYQSIDISPWSYLEWYALKSS